MSISIDGKQLADTILAKLRQQITAQHLSPHLEVILVGDNPSSVSFIKQKQKAAESIGATVHLNQLPVTISKEEMSKLIHSYNTSKKVSGIIIQRPLPTETNIPASIVSSIDPKKDVDGFVPHSGHEVPVAKGIVSILEHIFYTHLANKTDFVTWLRSQHTVVIGKGETAGKPIAQSLQRLSVPLVIIDRSTQHPEELTKKATIIISCAGTPGLITSASIQAGVILLAVGMNKEDGAWVGDYRVEDIKDKASFYTPTPGGVGPVNVACLMQNLVTTAEF